MAQDKQEFTRDEVIAIIDKIFEYGDLVIDAIASEDPKTTAEEFLDLAENDLQTN